MHDKNLIEGRTLPMLGGEECASHTGIKYAYDGRVGRVLRALLLAPVVVGPLVGLTKCASSQPMKGW